MGMARTAGFAAAYRRCGGCDHQPHRLMIRLSLYKTPPVKDAGAEYVEICGVGFQHQRSPSDGHSGASASDDNFDAYRGASDYNGRSTTDRRREG